MGKTRRTGDLVTDNNLFVNPTDDSFHVGTGITMYGGSVGIISCTGLYIGGSSVSAGGGDVVDDTTPQLGGDLDLNSSDITGTGNIDITGNVYASGLVGIGTDNPIRTLHIIGNGNPAVLIEDGSGTDQTSTQYKSSATHWSTGIIHGEDAFVINKSDNLTNGTAALYISSTNNVGLSTESPTSKLHVVGDAKISGVVTATTFSGSGSSLTGLTGAGASTYGSAGAAPVIVVDSNGRITGISTAAISSGGGGGGGVTTGKAIAMAMVFG